MRLELRSFLFRDAERDLLAIAKFLVTLSNNHCRLKQIENFVMFTNRTA